jgi:hypothetical protein
METDHTGVVLQKHDKNDDDDDDVLLPTKQLSWQEGLHKG